MTEVLPHSHSAFQFSHILAHHTKLHLVSHFCTEISHQQQHIIFVDTINTYLVISLYQLCTYCLVLDVHRVESCTLPLLFCILPFYPFGLTDSSDMHPVLPRFWYHHCYLEIYCYPSWSRSNCTCFNASLYFARDLVVYHFLEAHTHTCMHAHTRTHTQRKLFDHPCSHCYWSRRT